MLYQTSYDENNKTWSGWEQTPKYGEQASLGEEAYKTLMTYPDNIAQICYHNDRKYSNWEIADLTVRVAQHFELLQLQQCDIVGLCASNSDFVSPLFFGAMLSGLTISTLDPSFDKAAIKNVFGVTKPKIMFCDGGIYWIMKQALSEIHLHIEIYTMKDHIAGVPEISEFLEATGFEFLFTPQPLKMGSLQTAAILCSSGSTGTLKVSCVSHATLLNTTSFADSILSPGNKFLSFSTLYWFSGIMCLIVGTMSGATRVISDRPFCPENYFDMIERYRVAITFMPASNLAMVVASPKIGKYDLSSVRINSCGGSAVPYYLIKKLSQHMPQAIHITGYGMSEVSSVVSLGFILPSGTSGQIMPNYQIQIRDENQQCLGPCELGEICVRSKFPWLGYYGDPMATSAAYDEQGWFRTGDMGFMDLHGYIYIAERKKDILRYNEHSYFPTEIERLLIEMPGVAQVCVCGLNDIVSLHLPAAAIVRMPDSNISEEDVYNYVAKRMEHYKHLRGGVYFLSELPKTASGKYIRPIVADICENMRHDRYLSNF